MVVSDIMLTASAPLTLAQIADKASRVMGKPVSEKAVRAKLTELKDPEVAGLVLVRTIIDKVMHYEILVPRATDEVMTPAGVVPAKPRRPIVFGRAINTTPLDSPPPTPAAGSRAANAFIESLKQ